MITRKLIEAPDGRGWVFLAILAAAALLVPCLNLIQPPSSPFHVPTSAVALWGKYLCYALLALSLDDRWSRPFYVKLHIAELVGGGDITGARRNFDITVSHDPEGSATLLASPMRKILSVEKNNRIRRGIRTGPARRDDSGLCLWSREGSRLLRLRSRAGE